MAKVMKVNGSAAQAYARFDFALHQSEVWLKFRMRFAAAAITYWITEGNTSNYFATLRDEGSGALEARFDADQSDVWDVKFPNAGGVPSLFADAWHIYELHYKDDNTAALYIDGNLITTGAANNTDGVGILRLGYVDGFSFDARVLLYFDDVQVGTTQGGSDIFSDDFESGDFSAWTSTTGDVSVIDDPFVPPPPPPRVRVYADLPIRTFVTTKEARTLSILDHRATDRQFLWVLNGPAYHTAQVASDDLEINQPFPDADSPANLTNNRRLIYALQRWQGADPPYQPIFGGILMIPEDQGTDTPTTRYTAYDGWQYMMSRPVRNPETGALPGPSGLTFPAGSLASDIALGLLEITEILDGETHIEWYSGDIEPSDPLPSAITFDAGLSVGEAWQQLCNTGTIDIHLDPMYEPIDAPGKINRFRVVAQSEGSAAGPVRYNVVMGWDKGGRSLAGVNRLVDGTRLANEIQYFAGQGGTPVPTQTDAASVAAYGEYWAQQFFPGSNDILTIALLAVAELAIRRNGARSISLDPAPERVEIPLRDYGLGDYLPVWASKNLREPLGIDYDAFDPDNPGASGYQRVYAIPMQVDDNGVAKVSGILTSKEN